jgi:hydrogenase maturation factor
VKNSPQVGTYVYAGHAISVVDEEQAQERLLEELMETYAAAERFHVAEDLASL